MKAKITFTPAWTAQTGEKARIVDKLTEIHYCYDSTLEPQTAFESDIEDTGFTIPNKFIQQFEVSEASIAEIKKERNLSTQKLLKELEKKVEGLKRDPLAYYKDIDGKYFTENECEGWNWAIDSVLQLIKERKI